MYSMKGTEQNNGGGHHHDGRLRVVMFPWLGFGHVSPFLELGKKLSLRNFEIYICSTPATLEPVKKKLAAATAGDAASVSFLELTLPSSPELPPQNHTTNGLPPHLMPHLKEAFEASRPAFAQLLRDIKPDLLIYDFLPPWAPQEAEGLGIPAIQFITMSSTFTCFKFQQFNQPGVEFPFPTIRYRDYELARMAKANASTPRERREKDERSVRDCFSRSCGLVLIKTYDEIEGQYSNFLTTLTGKRIVPVGALVQEPSKEDGESEAIEWLNGKEEKSTVFVSFGSEYFLTEEDLTEIAHGLFLSNLNFLWVLRFPKGGNRDNLKHVFRFLERVGDRGLVVDGWAPQAKILEHPSIGGFVSHCGWSSVMEGMKYGVPIIAMPMHIDQPVNTKLAAEVGVAMEVVRDNSGKHHRRKIAAVIEMVVQGEGGKGVRAKAAAMREMLAEKGDKEIDKVAEELRKLCAKNLCRRSQKVLHIKSKITAATNGYKVVLAVLVMAFLIFFLRKTVENPWQN
ncbi:unnamed protein product [Cuscuta campestris]|uniref:Glycosyltransferase n=1 Tax=Cuscuta campestris TaxID=132261 RepID=A0A484L972_9ASTE|nr:unnamed protein product [Cuscuta campestris]